MDIKQCNDCKQEKPRDEFNGHPLGKLGLQAYCKSCQRIRNREYARKRTGYYERRKRVPTPLVAVTANFFPSPKEFYYG